MREPRWILESVVLKLYEQQMREHGGEYGIRDIGLLQSALTHPKNLWQYKKSSLHNLAAGYAARICTNHPFIDGNKRVAYVVMRLFLKLNGKDIDASPQDKIKMFMRLAAGHISENELSEWILSHIR
jgi:death-on-curing protein